MAREAWVCALCGRDILNSYDRYVERLEYRRADGKSRRAVFNVRRLCVQCVDGEIEKRQPPNPWHQENLF